MMAHHNKIVEELPPTCKSILETVAYYDIFDYPVTPGEIHKYLHHSYSSLQDIQGHLATTPLKELMVGQNGYYALKDRSEIFETRKKRQHYSRQLWERTSHYIRLLSAIPFVRFIAVTGGLCMNNNGPGSDIDIFILTKKGYLWRCRFIIQSIARWIRFQWGDVLCVNYILAEDNITYNYHSLYLAHEFAQMKPQYGWDIYHNIFEENDWIYRYLPNFTPETHTNSSEGENKNSTKRDKNKLYKNILGILPENTLRRWQINRIQKNNSTLFLQSPGVILEQNQYKMHDKQYDQTITQLFKTKCQSLNLKH